MEHIGNGRRRPTVTRDCRCDQRLPHNQILLEKRKDGWRKAEKGVDGQKSYRRKEEIVDDKRRAPMSWRETLRSRAEEEQSKTTRENERWEK